MDLQHYEENDAEVSAAFSGQQRIGGAPVTVVPTGMNVSAHDLTTRVRSAAGEQRGVIGDRFPLIWSVYWSTASVHNDCVPGQQIMCGVRCGKQRSV